MAYKLGSLFDGSGGFPLAGRLCGIVPAWAAEIEPYPIAVTRSRFPDMRHLGDISKVNGAEIEPVDIITFGSPCQDLSVAGKRAGLKHADNGDEETTRSGLFIEAVRIIKEMRAATNGVYPRFALWENVPGAFSSNKGEDFRIVLQELIQINEPAAVMPAVPKNGWPYADSYCGDGWSLAYRVFDAQYWGVPQRRRRIHLVVDFAGQCARNVLFERKGVRGYFDQSGPPRQTAADLAKGGARAADCAGIGLDIYNLAVTGQVAASLTTATGQGAANTGPSVAVPYTLKIRSGCEGGGKGALVQTNKSATIKTCNDQYLFQPIPIHAQAMSYRGEKGEKQVGRGNGLGIGEPGAPGNTLRTKDTHAVFYCKQREDIVQYIIRRLTPTECARLQGFADEWGHIEEMAALTPEEYAFWLEVRNTHAAINGKAVKDYTPAQMLTWYNKLHTDSSEYKMWGNGIALPPALYCMQGIMDAFKREEGTA